MRITKTIKIAMRELIDQDYYVILLNNEVFDLIATNKNKMRLIKTIYTESDKFDITKQKERLTKFYKYPKFSDEKMLTRNKCFSKELWVRGKKAWVSKIIINGGG